MLAQKKTKKQIFRDILDFFFFFFFFFFCFFIMKIYVDEAILMSTLNTPFF